MRMNNRLEKRGFTLIELLVVIAIIGILSSVVFSSISNARMKGRDARRVADLKQIALALELYFDANGQYPSVFGYPLNTGSYYDYSDDPTSWGDLQTKLQPYIPKLPKDPINNGTAPWFDGGYEYVYGNVGDGLIALDNATGALGYDLVTQLETPGHPLSCGRVHEYKSYFRLGNWCDTWSPQMYSGSLKW